MNKERKEEPKKCMYSKDDYTDEDRKVLCDGCEKECKYIKSDDFTKALAECIMQAQGSVVDPMVQAEIWKDELIKLAKSEEPVSEDLDLGCGVIWKGEEQVSEDLEDYINELSKQFPEVSFAKLSRIAVRVAKWQKQHLWKPADGDDLPEYEREVVAFQEIFPTDVDVPSLLKIVIAHRPNPNGWDGKSISTGEVEHYTPKTYDKGGWNIPNVKYWLDCLMPKEI